MADPPPPQTCTAPRCNYNTPLGAPTWDVVLGLIQVHNQAAHTVSAPVQPQPGGQVRDGGEGGDRGAGGKLDKRPRPQATTDMTEHDFKHGVTEVTSGERYALLSFPMLKGMSE